MGEEDGEGGRQSYRGRESWVCVWGGADRYGHQGEETSVDKVLKSIGTTPPSLPCPPPSLEIYIHVCLSKHCV